MNKKKLCVLFTSALILLIVIISPYTSEESNGCIRCHSGFEPFSVEIIGPVEIPLDETFEISAVITNNENNENSDDDDDDGFPYTLKDIDVKLNLSNSENLKLMEGNYSVKPQNLASGERTILVWKFKAINPGEIVIRCTISATVYHKHDSDNPDSYSYIVEAEELSLKVKSLPLHLSIYSITLTVGQEKSFEIILTTDEDINEIIFIPSNEIAPYLYISFSDDDNGFTNLKVGEWKILNLTIYSPKNNLIGKLDVSWINSTGTKENISISINILKEPTTGTEQINWFSISGRISGILLLVLLVISIVFGGFPPNVKKYIRKLGKKRVELHCQISYLIVALSIFHLSVLIAGPWGDNLLDRGLILGFVALGLFIVLGIHGAFQRKFIKNFGIKKWRWTHRFLTIAVILLVLIHAIKIGTEFKFLR